jgi:hypothetical protein
MAQKPIRWGNDILLLSFSRDMSQKYARVFGQEHDYENYEKAHDSWWQVMGHYFYCLI